MTRDTATPSPEELRTLEGLPQRFDVWQADARQAGATVRLEDGRLARPWLVAVASRTENFILTCEVEGDAPGPNEVWAALSRAMRQPAAGEAHRPTAVEFATAAWAAALAGALEAVNVGCEAVERLGHLDEVYEALAGVADEPGPGEPGLLDAPGVTPEAVGSFFDAAAVFYEQAPWARTGDRPVRVECGRFEGGPWYAVLLGQGGVTCGLALYDDLETLRGIEREELSEEERARRTAALVVTFGEESDLAAADAEAARRYGWRVAGPGAYPLTYRLDPGLAMRPPLAWELALLEGCLRGLPEFSRKKARRLAPLALTVPTAAGDLALVLGWAEG
jgi:hypothetical protein